MVETKTTINWLSVQGKFFRFFKHISIQPGLSLNTTSQLVKLDKLAQLSLLAKLDLSLIAA